MNKKNVLYILLDAVFLIVFNTVFFVVGGTDHPASVWLSYAFIHFAYGMVLVTPFLTRKSSSAAVFGFALYSVSAAYFMLEFVVGLIFILIRSDSVKAPLTVQIIIAGVYAVLLLSNMIANEHTGDAVQRKEAEVAYIKTAAARVQSLRGKSADKQVEKALERLYDAIHASPTRSTPGVQPLEQDILRKISLLTGAVQTGQADKVQAICGETIALVAERNRQLKIGQ